MTTDLLALLVAIAMPLLTVGALAGLIAGLRSLDRSRDELVELSQGR